MDKVKKHIEICNELTQMYKKKNSDYGNSFGSVLREEGFVSVVTRMKDKIYRLSSLNKKGNIEVQNEKIEDTLLDLANYSIMSLIELEEIKSINNKNDEDLEDEDEEEKLEEPVSTITINFEKDSDFKIFRKFFTEYSAKDIAYEFDIPLSEIVYFEEEYIHQPKYIKDEIRNKYYELYHRVEQE